MPEVALKNAEGAIPPLRISRTRQVLFTSVIFVVFLALLEVALRILGIPHELQDLRTDPGLVNNLQQSIFFYTPGWSGYQAGALLHINSQGWRGKEFSPEKRDGTIR